MTNLIRRLRGILIALVALALSAGLAFGAQPDAAAWGLGNAASHAGKTVPVQAGDEDAAEDEDTAEDSEEEDAAEDSAEAGENCSTDPSDPEITPEELDAMRHGSIVCWAAHQTEWPEWFANHGAFVKCWAHTGKADAISCTEDPAAEEPSVDEPTGNGASAGRGHGKGKGHNK